MRVQQNPEQTNKIVERLLRKDLPEFVREDVEQWKRDVHSWQSEEGSSVPATATEFLSKAKELVGQAQQLQSYYADHSADLRFLRVVHYANQLFGKSPTDAEKAEAFLLLAISYEALRDPLLWDVNEYYYEACVRALPHSEVARTCYQRLSSEIYYGYTGSGGTDIPWDEQERLKKYRNLAQ